MPLSKYCSAGSCVTRASAGEECSDAVQCLDGHRCLNSICERECLEGSTNPSHGCPVGKQCRAYIGFERLGVCLKSDTLSNGNKGSNPYSSSSVAFWLIGSVVIFIAMIICIALLVGCLKSKNRSNETKIRSSQQSEPSPYSVIQQPMISAPLDYVGATPLYVMAPPANNMSPYQHPSEPPSYYEAVEAAGGIDNHDS